MTLPFIDDFERRREQVKRYLAIVSRAERETRLGAARKMDIDRLHLLRAGTYLILYNLIEASARGAIDAIHDDMAATRTSFAELTPQLRREVVKGFKRNADPNKHGELNDLPVDFVAASLDVEYHFSGNVDSKLLRKIGEIYGFSCDVGADWLHKGADLLQIKTNRNDLAHGDKTYDQVGRSSTARELIGVSLRATGYVREILLSVERYVNEKGYRA